MTLLELRSLTDLQIPIVLSFGKIEGKGATNVVPDVVEIAGTLRCFDEHLRFLVHKQIEDICQSVAEKYLTHCNVNILKGYPVLINNAIVTSQARSLAQDFMGTKNVFDLPTRMGSEDFAYYTHYIPACFYRLGVGNKKKGITSSIHTPTFNIDEDALKESIGLMSWIAINS